MCKRMFLNLIYVNIAEMQVAANSPFSYIFTYLNYIDTDKYIGGNGVVEIFKLTQSLSYTHSRTYIILKPSKQNHISAHVH